VAKSERVKKAPSAPKAPAADPELLAMLRGVLGTRWDPAPDQDEKDRAFVARLTTPARRRLRETRIPWPAAYALVAGRLALHGLPIAQRNVSVHRQLERMLGDALDKLGHKDVGRTSVSEHATRLEEAIAKAQQFWPPRRRPNAH
jgi:hypothetical protein